MAAGYQKAANIERNQMWLWQGVTVASLSVFVWVALNYLLPDAQQNFSWPNFAQRFLVTAAFAALAGFAGRQAAKAAEKERRNRRFELELASLGPFLANHPPEKRQEIMEAYVQRTFGNELGALEVAGENTGRLMDVLSEAIRALGKNR